MKPSPPDPLRFRRAAALLVAILSLAAIPPAASAQAPSKQLEDVKRALDKSRARQQAIDRQAAEVAAAMKKLQARSVAAARKAQDLESEISRVEDRLETLVSDEKLKARDLSEQRGRLTRLIAAIQRMARHPPAALIALPTKPNDTVRSAILLRTTIPAVRASADRLRGDLDALNKVRDEIAQKRHDLNTAEKALAVEQGALRNLTRDKRRVEARLRAERSAEADKAAALAAEADSLRELLNRIEKQRGDAEREERARAEEERRQLARRTPPPAPAAAPPRPPPKPQKPQEARLGRGMPLPARGRIVQGFGDKTNIGDTAKGLSIATRSGAQVVAPHDGTVVFAGPFKRVGRLLIIEHAGGYHTLLAGFARIDVGVGRRVVAGEPVGIMSASPKPAPTLYFELRHRGQPINPMPWLAASNSKVR